jgi:hypothetical protein
MLEYSLIAATVVMGFAGASAVVRTTTFSERINDAFLEDSIKLPTSANDIANIGNQAATFNAQIQLK